MQIYELFLKSELPARGGMDVLHRVVINLEIRVMVKKDFLVHRIIMPLPPNGIEVVQNDQHGLAESLSHSRIRMSNS